jgi:hypothetical protein
MELFKLHRDSLCKFIRNSVLSDHQQESLLDDINTLTGPQLEPLFLLRERYYTEKAIANRELRKQYKKITRKLVIFIPDKLSSSSEDDSPHPYIRKSHFNFSI